MGSQLSNIKFQLTSVCTATQAAGTTFTVTNDLIENTAITATNASILLSTLDGKSIERMVVTFAAGTATIVARGLTRADSLTADSNLQKERRVGTIGKIVSFAFDGFDANSTDAKTLPGAYTFTGDNTHSGAETFNKSIKVPVYADATARDTAIPTPANGMLIYNTALGVNQQYVGGAWVNVEAGGTFPNASETVAGKVEQATNAEMGTSTELGTTGAPLFVNPKNLVKTSSGSADENKIPILNASGKLNDGFVNTTALLDETFVAGENITAGQCVFVEAGPLTAAAITKQEISKTAADTRVSFPIFGTGVGAASFKVNICKTGTPSENLNFRIETDNAGSPSGTLVNANAIATIAQASLTTNLADTTLNLGVTGTSNAHGVTLNSTEASQSVYKGVKFTMTNQTGILTVTKDSDCTATTAYLYNNSGVLLSSVAFSTHTATFQYNGIVDGETYYVLCGSGGSSYTSVKQTGAASYPYSSTDLDYIAGGEVKQGSTALTETLSSTGTYQGDSFGVNAGGMKFTALKNIYVTGSTGHSTNISKAKLYTSAMVLIENVNVVAGVAAFTPYRFLAGESFYIIYDNNGGNVRIDKYEASFPQAKTNVSMISGIINGSDDGNYSHGVSSVITYEEAVSTDTDINNITAIETGIPVILNEGTKYHLVAFQGTYGSETVNNANYYNIGYSTNNTTTRGSKLRDGAAYGSIVPAKRCYVSSTAIQDNVLSLTDSDYVYKSILYGISTETKAVGLYPKLTIQGINGEQSGLTMGTDYYLGATPGSISATPGTYPIIVGKSISSTKIKRFVDSRVIVSGTTYQVCDLTSTRTVTNIGLPYVLYKSCQVTVSGIYKVTFALNSTSNFDLYGKIYVNGAAIGTERVVQLTGGSWDEDIKVNAGDVIGIYCYKGSINANPGQLTKLQVRYSIRNLLPITASTVD